MCRSGISGNLMPCFFMYASTGGERRTSGGFTHENIIAVSYLALVDGFEYQLPKSRGHEA